ncbi:MAG TPA: class I SAM-dependent methyltransferase [Deltaproteobacteria bacterium]|nr:class I SAM-dependent methyltransferase [Deltaproteobacteria bacterium]
MKSEREKTKTKFKEYYEVLWKRRREQKSQLVDWLRDRGRSFQYFLDEMLRGFGLPICRDVLIICVGDNNDEKVFRKCNYKNIVGIDISFQALCVERKDNISKAQMDAENLSFKNEVFDIVYVQNALMQVDKKCVFDNIYRVLKSGGCFILAESLKGQYLIEFFTKSDSGQEIKHDFFNHSDEKYLSIIFSELLRKDYFYITPWLHLLRIFNLAKLIPWFLRIEKKVDILLDMLLRIKIVTKVVVEIYRK